jgi:hypothetical protein
LVIDQDCGGNAGLAELVRALLAMHEHEPESAPPPAAAIRDYAPPAERVGARVGRYRLMEQIGEWGFGLAFVAEWRDPVTRKVAVLHSRSCLKISQRLTAACRRSSTRRLVRRRLLMGTSRRQGGAFGERRRP